MSTRKILVTGATGQQGGQAVRALLARPPPFPYEILALTRNASSSSAKNLSKNHPKITLIEGNLDHCETVFEKAGGRDSVWGVFLVPIPRMKKGEEAHEERQGKAMVDAAVRNGVKHFVFSSVDRGRNGDDDPTPVPHFITKFNIEKHLQKKAAESGMTWTILRPVAFMENLNGPFGAMFAAMWRNMGREKKLQLVCTKDIGVFGALAFAQCETADFKNTAIGLAGDDLTQMEAGNVFIDVIKRPMPRFYGFAGSLVQWMVPELRIMFQWFVDVGYAVDIAECKRLNPEMLDFKTWLEQESDYKK